MVKPRLRAAIVFGSVARGQATQESDLDVLILAEEGAREAIVAAIYEIERDTEVRVGAIIVSPSLEGVDRQFVENLLREGRPLVGELPPVTVKRLDLRPYRIIRFSLQGLSHREKTRLDRALYGYAT